MSPCQHSRSLSESIRNNILFHILSPQPLPRTETVLSRLIQISGVTARENSAQKVFFSKAKFDRKRQAKRIGCGSRIPRKAWMNERGDEDR